MARPDPRPDLTLPLERLIQNIVEHVEELADTDPMEILLVALSARGAGAATVRPFADFAQSVQIDGVPKRWELGLRPIFFQTGDATRRLTTIIHELLHMSSTDPSGLRPEFRHANCSQDQLDQLASKISEYWLTVGDIDLIQPLAHHGEGLFRHWLIRPHLSLKERDFSKKDIFDAPICMVTPQKKRSVWWVQ